MQKKSEGVEQGSPAGVPILAIRDNEPTDISCQVRVNLMRNGYALKHKDEPIFYPTIEECAEAAKQGLIAAFASYAESNPPY
jgi:hypothetical protein